MNTTPQVVIAPRVRPGLNYSEAFGFLFKRPNGWRVILVGGILLMFSWLIVPLLVVMGYGVALGRATAAGDPELPRFELGMAGDGLKALVVIVLYALPIFVVYFLAFIPIILLGESAEPPPAFFLLTFGMMFLVMIYGLALAAVQPALFAVFIADGTIGSCFRFQRIKEVMKAWGGDYAGAAAIVFGMAYLFQFGFILLLIGIFFTAFYHLAFTSNVAGQLARPLITGIPPSFPEPGPASPVAAGPLAPAPPAPATAETDPVAPAAAETAVEEPPPGSTEPNSPA